MNNKHRLEETIGRPLDLVEERTGVIAYWSGSGIAVDPQELATAMALHAPRFTKRVRKTTAEPLTAARRAIRRRQSSQATRDRSHFWRESGIRTHESTDDKGNKVVKQTHLVVAYATERTDAQQDQTGSYGAQCAFNVVVDLVTGDMTTEGAPFDDESRDGLRLLRDRFNKERGFLTSDDVGDMLSTIFVTDLKAIRTKEGGAVYFLEKGKDNDVIDLAKALAEVGTKVPQLKFEEVAPRSAGQYRSAIQGSLLDDINSLKEECTKRLSDMNTGGVVTRGETLDARLSKVDELRGRAFAFERLLKIKLTDVTASADACEAMYRAAIKEVQFRIAPVAPVTA